MKLNRFTWFCWGLLAYNILVILWGSYVRASVSGAGCGAHWPLCNGLIIPQTAHLATLIEFTHRLTSGITLIGSVVLFIWSWRRHSRTDPLRLSVSLVLGFTLSEALLGAGLVLFQLVDQNASLARAISVAAHLVNTQLLLAALTLTAWLASGGRSPGLYAGSAEKVLLGIALSGVLLLSASGAITALGDTLFPSGSISAGIQQDFLPTANLLVRLRIYHPLIAVSLGIYLIVTTLWVSYRAEFFVKRFATLFLCLFVVQLTLGVLNITLLAPIWLQMVHLVVADLVWISLILLSLAVYSQKSIRQEKPGNPDLPSACSING